MDERKNLAFTEKDEYIDFFRKEIVKMVDQIEDKITLKKIYTVIKTFIDILNEKEGG